MKHRLETTPGLDIRQGEIVRLERLASGEWLLTTRLEVQYTAKAVILATGTFLKGKIFVGDVSYEGGPDGHVRRHRADGLPAGAGDASSPV